MKKYNKQQLALALGISYSHSRALVEALRQLNIKGCQSTASTNRLKLIYEISDQQLEQLKTAYQNILQKNKLIIKTKPAVKNRKKQILKDYLSGKINEAEASAKLKINDYLLTEIKQLIN